MCKHSSKRLNEAARCVWHVGWRACGRVEPRGRERDGRLRALQASDEDRRGHTVQLHGRQRRRLRLRRRTTARSRYLSTYCSRRDMTRETGMRLVLRGEFRKALGGKARWDLRTEKLVILAAQHVADMPSRRQFNSPTG